MSQAFRDSNRIPSLLVAPVVGASTLTVTGVTLTNATPAHVAIVDGVGTQITSFGSGGVVASFKIGQYKVTAAAVQLGSNVLTNGAIFTALSTNLGNVFIGGAGVTTTVDGTGNGYILEPGNSVSAAITNLNLLYVIGTANDVLSWIGS